MRVFWDSHRVFTRLLIGIPSNLPFSGIATFSGNVGVVTPNVDAVLEVGAPGNASTRNTAIFISDKPTQ
jgi:hypothetical protein